MTIIQLLMLGASAFFAYKIYEHIQTLEDTEKPVGEAPVRTAEAFSIFDSTVLIQKADEERENNNLEKALAIYAEANIKEQRNAETLFKMGYTLALQERDEEAVEYFLESIQEDDSNPFAYLEMAKVYKKLGDATKADLYEKKAKAIDDSL